MRQMVAGLQEVQPGSAGFAARQESIYRNCHIIFFVLEEIATQILAHSKPLD